MIRTMRISENYAEICYYTFFPSIYKHYGESNRKKNQNKSVLILETGPTFH